VRACAAGADHSHRSSIVHASIGARRGVASGRAALLLRILASSKVSARSRGFAGVTPRS
jgi:hypothetical protein